MKTHWPDNVSQWGVIMTKIFDVIEKKNTYNTHYYVVLDKPVEFKYEEIEPNFFQAECCGFYTALNKRGESGDAFAGREFEIDMVDGSKIKAKGNFWSVSPRVKSSVEGDTLIDVGVSDLESLKRCYVFTGSAMLKSELDKWLRDNKPKHDYYFYDRSPSAQESIDLINKWSSESGYFYHAIFSNDQQLKIHCLAKIERQLEQKDSMVKSLRSDINAKNHDIDLLLNHFAQQEDINIKDYEQVEDWLSSLTTTTGFDFNDYLEFRDEREYY